MKKIIVSESAFKNYIKSSLIKESTHQNFDFELEKEYIENIDDELWEMLPDSMSIEIHYDINFDGQYIFHDFEFTDDELTDRLSQEDCDSLNDAIYSSLSENWDMVSEKIKRVNDIYGAPDYGI